MATIVGTLFGFLGDLVGTHVFTNGVVPQALRRRWNLVGFTVTDDESNGWLTIEPVGGSELVGDPDAVVGATQDVLVAAGRHVDIDADSDIKIGADDANSIEIGHVGITTDILGTLWNNGGPLASSFDPNATTVILAGATTTDLRFGDDSPSHRPTWSVWAGGITFDATTIDLNGTAVRIAGQRMVAKVAYVVATSNITLSGAQTIDGESIGGGTTREVLAVGQSTATDNGLYSAPSGGGAWTRRVDFDATADYVLGTTVTIQAGTSGKGKRYRLDALSSSLPATWVEIASGGSSITDGTGTLGFLGAAGALSTTGVTSVTHVGSGAISLTTSSGNVTIDTAGDDIEIGTSASSTRMGAASTDNVTASSGGITTRSATSHVEFVGSASRTVTASGSATTHTYNGALSVQTTGDATIGIGNVAGSGNLNLGLAYAGGFASTTTINGYNSLLQATGASIVISALTQVASSAALQLNGTHARCGVYGGSDAMLLVWPTAVTPGSSAATAVGTLTVPASSSGRFRGVLGVRNGSSNDKQMDVELRLERRRHHGRESEPTTSPRPPCRARSAPSRAT
jgi:hypothetical protein